MLNEINLLNKMEINILLKLMDTNLNDCLYEFYKNLRKVIIIKNKNKQYNVDKIIIKLEKQIRKNINNAILLTKQNPNILLDTIKICECEDKEINKILCCTINDWLNWRNDDNDNDNDNQNENENENENKDNLLLSLSKSNTKSIMKEKVKSEILSYIISLIENLQIDNAENDILKCLLKIDNHMKDYNFIADNFDNIFPSHYKIIPYYIETYYKFLKPLLIMHLDNNNIKNDKIIFVISWITKFKLKIINLSKNIKIKINQQEIILNILSDQYEILLSSVSEDTIIIHNLLKEVPNMIKLLLNTNINNSCFYDVYNNLYRLMIN